MKIKSLILLCWLACAVPAFATPSKPALYVERAAPATVHRAMEAILRLPEGRALVAAVEREGAFTVVPQVRGAGEFNAYWQGDRRRVVLNLSHERSEASLIRSIVFELHNALTDSQLRSFYDRARKGQISKAAYVEGIERMEYGNVLKAAALLKKGIAAGLFPSSAKWDPHARFEDHYRVQQVMGHSAWLADRYDKVYARGMSIRYT